MDPELTKIRDRILRILNIDPQSSNFVLESDIALLAELHSLLWGLCGGDTELMRHWMYTFNSHLGYTPVLRVHYPRYLTEMVGYLTGLNH